MSFKKKINQRIDLYLKKYFSPIEDIKKHPSYGYISCRHDNGSPSFGKEFSNTTEEKFICISPPPYDTVSKIDCNRVHPYHDEEKDHLLNLHTSIIR